MQMSFGVRNGETHVIVYPSFNASVTESFVGNFLNAKGEIISVEMATADGAPVVAKMVRLTLALLRTIRTRSTRRLISASVCRLLLSTP